MSDNKLIFQTSPVVTFATNTFKNCPVILQYEDTPLLSVLHEKNLGFTTSIPIYHPDGTYLAKVNGTRIFPTNDGKKAGLQMRSLKDMTVCEMNGQTLFEIHHQPGDAFKTHAELYSPDGCFINCADEAIKELNLVNSNGKKLDLIDLNGLPLTAGGATFSDCSFEGCSIGVRLRSNGVVTIGG